MRAAQLFLLAAFFFTSLETPAAQPPAKPAELKVLDRLAGEWRYEWESKPTESDAKGSKGSGTSTNEWILDGWFQQHKGKGDDPPHEILEVWTYDAHTKTYRAWGFMAPGANHYAAIGNWDEETKTLTYKGKGPGDVTTVSTMRFIDKDNRVGTRVAKDAAGNVVQDTHFKLTRQNSRELSGRGSSQEKDQEPAPFPDAERKPWARVGNSPGFMGEWATGLAQFDLQYQQGRGYIPAFRIGVWPPKRKLSSLPVITVPFGLDFQSVKDFADADLKELAGQKNLQSLRLSYTSVTGAGLKDLSGLKNFQHLDLGYTPVQDAGLKELAGIKNLQSLLLEGTTVTDAGLKELTTLKSLRTVSLTKTRVTEAGVRKFKEALPDCRVIHDKWGDPPPK